VGRVMLRSVGFVLGHLPVNSGFCYVVEMELGYLIMIGT